MNARQLRMAFCDAENSRREGQSQVRCSRCGRRFPIPEWYADQGVQLRFCSNACRTAWGEVSAEEGPSVQMGGRPDHRGGNWEAQAARTRERDGFRCRLCGVSEERLERQLDVHHLVPARTFEYVSDSNQLSNLVTVCPSCHKKLEDAGCLDLPLFQGVKHPGKRQAPENGT